MSLGLRRVSRWMILAAVLISTMAIAAAAGTAPLKYTIDMRERADDLFKVSLVIDDLGDENDMYQFAFTAPGTYETMDIGRFVREFHSYDAEGAELPVKQLSVNQWKLERPKDVRRIAYTIADTWDMKVDEHPIYHMCGSSMEARYVQLMPHAVLGYPKGMQSRALALELLYPSEWSLGSALDRNSEGQLIAESYDHVVDSPILLGELTYAAMEIKGSKVEFYCYSATGKYDAQKMLDETRDVIEAVAAFLKGFPVPRYTFIFLFDDQGEGAWEHSYSSNYTFPESMFGYMADQLDEITAHEIFHIVTPLNIHSELIEPFNFANPKPSRHLWLYEATTEWAAQAMLLRSGAIDLEQYLANTHKKLLFANGMRKDLSLTDLALNSYETAGAVQFPNIYMRGALTSTLLDIRLLELSGGKRGLREVLLELAADYGKHKSFSEEGFFDEFARRTFPEIRDFLSKYVEGHEPLPYKEYFAKLGINYIEKQEAETIEPSLGFHVRGEAAPRLVNVNPMAKADGIKEDDILLAINEEAVDSGNAVKLIKQAKRAEVGTPFTLKLKRGEEEVSIMSTVQGLKMQKQHVLEVDEQASAEVLALREAWSKNL